jgi:MscS family membrane protein
MPRSSFSGTGRLLGALSIALVVAGLPVRGQVPAPAVQKPAVQPEPPRDALGRSTPRGTVIGFLTAARKGEDELARQYLNTGRDTAAATDLAHQLFVVLDARLPARLTQLSDEAEGSRSNPLMPNQEVVGTIESAGGPVEIVLERVTRADAGPIWLFSRRTLDAIPALSDEVTADAAAGVLPRFLVDNRLGGIRLFEWLAVLFGLPLFYFATVLLNRMLTPLKRQLWRRIFQASDPSSRNILPAPARLLIVVVVSRCLVSSLPLSLLVRQLFFNAASLIAIAAVAWLLILLNGEVEQYVRQRSPRANFAAAISLLRVGRRVVDLLVLFAALLATLRHFDIDPTPVIAGLGVGGIAVALAAQKTLENVIGGASLIFDQAVRVGDFLKVGDIQGTVDHIGLRSIRIRTLDRTVVTVPNGQIASMSLETFSARDKFWFHPVLGLRYETTASQLRAIVDGIRRLLVEHASVDRESVRVRFLRLGAFSLDVDIFAYVVARDWNHFLEIQEQLLFSVTDVVNDAGTAIAFPSQTMYVTNAAAALPIDSISDK